MARPTKPTEVKKRLGNPGKRPLPVPVAVELVTATPDPPAHLEEAGRAAWFRIWRAGEKWLSPTTDHDLLVLIADAYDLRARIMTELSTSPLVSETEKGFLQAHPLLTVLRSTDRQLGQWLGQCGFTPSDRSRLGLSEVKRASKLEELFAQRASS